MASSRRPVGGQAPTAAPDRRLDHLERLARLLDSRFGIPGTRWSFGLDSLLGLVPGIGDGATAAISLSIVVAGWRLGASRATLARMAANVAVDFVIGSVPVLGDLFDVAWKANRRNVALLRRDLARRDPGR